MQPRIVSILISGYPTLDTAIRALQSDVYDFLIKPFRMELLSATVKRALGHLRLQQENMELREQIAVSDLIRSLDATLEPKEIVDAVINKILQQSDSTAVSLLLYNAERNRLELCGLEGDRATLDDPVCSEFLNGETATSTAVMLSGESVVLADRQESLFPQSARRSERICQPLMVSGQAIGLLNIVRSANAVTCGDGTLRTLGLIASHTAVTIENARLYKNLRSSYMDTVSALANAIEIRDPYTKGHTDRVKYFARAITSRLGWSDEQQYELWMGCTLHDIGKLGVPDSILGKPGPLTDDEFAVMKTHPEIGARLIEGVPCLRPALPYVYSHHERYDGSGYPAGRAGEDIPIEGRILAVVDAFDAITSNRPYRPSQPVEVAVEELRAFSGTQFDPHIVDLFIEVLSSEGIPWMIRDGQMTSSVSSVNP